MISRGQVWWAELGAAQGSGPAYRRPVVVISSDAFNHSAIQTVTAAMVSSTMRLADAPGNVLLAVGDGGLPRSSVVDVSQLATLDRDELLESVGSLDADTMVAVDAGLRRALAL